MKTETNKTKNLYDAIIIAEAKVGSTSYQLFYAGCSIDHVHEFALDAASDNDDVADERNKDDIRRLELEGMTDSQIEKCGTEGPASLDSDDLNVYNWCRTYLQMKNDDVHFTDSKCAEWGKIIPKSLAEEFKLDCYREWLSVKNSTICRKLNQAEIAHLFAQDDSLPDCFADYDKTAGNNEELSKYDEELKLFVEQAHGDIFIGEDDVIYAETKNSGGVYSKVNQCNKLGGLSFDCPMELSEAIANKVTA